MKKLLLILFLMLIWNVQTYGKEKGKPSIDLSVPIVDEIVESGKFPKVIVPELKALPPIEDKLLEPRMVNGTLYELSAFESKKLDDDPIMDELITSDFIEDAMSRGTVEREVFDDLFFEKKIDVNRVRKILPKNNYDFTRKQVPIDIRLVKKYSHKDKKMEGDMVEFIAEHDFVIKDKLFKKGTSILGRIELLSASDKMGTPESIKIDNFYIGDMPEISLNGSISKSGANRSIWVYPLYQAGNVCLYVAGFVFVPIHGGHVKMSTDDIYTVVYEYEE